MLVGNVYYVTSSYNETKFKALLEKQLSKNSASLPGTELVEQAIAAFLACEDQSVSDNAMTTFKQNLKTIEYKDHRKYFGDEVVGNPLDAVKAYNQLVVMYMLS